ncbi:MAG: amino-acid N-acetyltransferase [Treponema sp.]|nr:amino-acid N-acetyltransferase [Treponema sp.]
MQENIVSQNAQKIRDVIRYVERFRNALVVIHLDSSVIDSTLFASHIRDISLIHKAGIRTIIVPGAKNRIDQVLASSNISWKNEGGVRITNENAMPFIKMAAFDIANTVMTSLASEHISAVIGNWVRSRALGVINGIDYGCVGTVDKLQIDSIKKVLDNSFIPIFPCIGWSISGKPYNISSQALATEIAAQLQAEKLFFISANAEISKKNFIIPVNIVLSESGSVVSLTLQEAEDFISANKTHSDSEHNLAHSKQILSLVEYATTACKAGVSRTHILNGTKDGVIPAELFSATGTGTMIYKNDYGKIRAMQQDDVPALISLMAPFVASGKLLPRSERNILDALSDFVVYELDAGIRACAALHTYAGGQAEIGAVAVSESYASLGIGEKLVEELVTRAKGKNCTSVFVLSTQTFDWFESLGFLEDSIENIPEERKSLWSKKRGSKVYRRTL